MKRVAVALVLVVAALLTYATWPTKARRLSSTLDALIDAVEREKVDAASAILGEGFRFHGPGAIGSGDKLKAVDRLERLTNEVDRLRFTEIERHVDAATGEVTYRASLRASSANGPFAARIDARLRFEEADGRFTLKEAEILTAETGFR